MSCKMVTCIPWGQKVEQGRNDDMEPAACFITMIVIFSGVDVFFDSVSSHVSVVK